eukprot:COSAG03_NODE_16413_length_402_cov_1.534653_1_plen_90_part_01
MVESRRVEAQLEELLREVNSLRKRIEANEETTASANPLIGTSDAPRAAPPTEAARPPAGGYYTHREFRYIQSARVLISPARGLSCCGPPR